VVVLKKHGKPSIGGIEKRLGSEKFMIQIKDLKMAENCKDICIDQASIRSF